MSEIYFTLLLLIMLSTFCGAEVVPAISNFYNQNMGGVDLSDQVMYSYPFERKLKSWSKKLYSTFLHIF